MTQSLDTLTERINNLNTQVNQLRSELGEVTEIMKELITTNQQQLGEIMRLVNDHIETPHISSTDKNKKDG